MEVHLLLAALAGGVALFIWGAVSWMALPWHNTTYEQLTDEDDFVRAVERNAPASGAYGVPSPGGGCGGGAKSPEEKKALMAKAMARMKSGPMVFAVVTRGGMAPMWTYMLKSLLIGVIAAGLAAWLLQKTAIVTTLDRAMFVMLVAGVGQFSSHMLNWNWHNYPTRFTAVMLADAAVGWFLVGLAVAFVLPA